MSIDSYAIGAPQWVLPAVAIGLVLGALVLWNYLRAGLAAGSGPGRSGLGRWRWLALLLKGIGVATLLVCLVEPLGRGRRPQPQANVLPILVDRSASMQIQAPRGGPSAADRIGSAFAADQAWAETTERMFDVRQYAFDARLDRVGQWGDLVYDGAASNLRTALETLAQRYRGRAVAGCLLFSDGNATDLSEMSGWSEIGFPVFPVRDPDADRVRDLRVARVSVSQTDFETAPVTIDAAVQATDLPRREVVIRLIDAEQNVIQEQTGTMPGDSAELAVRFRFRPTEAGISFYRLQCFLSEERELFADQETGIEATLLNNTRWITVNQRRGPYPVLYVGGRPNWEFKYLRRALSEDAEVRLVSLLRIAKKQPKFSFGDLAVESSVNPLFAGLGGSEEEAAEQLDEPVILRLDVENGAELAGGFPQDPQALFPFSAIILDDVEADFFTQEELLLIRQFVTSRGGAVLMLGGEETLERGGFGNTPLGELAPVYLPRENVSDGPTAGSSSGAYRLQLTREGLLQPFLRLRGTEQAEQQRLSALPPLRVLNRAGRTKPGAVVLAVAVDASGVTHPALVSQSFGRGKTAALMLGDLWRWSLRRAPADEGPSTEGPSTEGPSTEGPSTLQGGEFGTAAREDPAQTWRQMVRWLISDVPRPVETSIVPAEAPGTVRIVTEVRDGDFAPLDGARLRLVVETPDSGPVELTGEPDLARPGFYQAEFWPRTPGGYRVSATAIAADGIEIGRDETGWTSDPTEREFERLGTGNATLDQIAEETGGRVLGYDELDDFANLLQQRPMPISEPWEFPLWHRSWVLLLAIGCLCGEWGIRRWKGLP